MAPNLVVARFKNGTILKGSSLDVDPARPICHIQTVDRGIVPVNLADLKALFFVKDVSGDPTRNEPVDPAPGDPLAHDRKQLVVEVLVGERIVGLTNRYPPLHRFFFIVPIDPKSNNVRILVNRDALTAMYSGSESAASPKQKR